MRVQAILCAEGVAVDGQSNLASVFNIIDEVTPEGLPFAIPKMIFFAQVERMPGEANDAELTVVITNNGAPIVRQAVRLNFQEKVRVRLINNVFGLVVRTAGTVEFALLDAARVSLGRWDVVVNAPPPRVAPQVVAAEPVAQTQHGS